MHRFAGVSGLPGKYKRLFEKDGWELAGFE